jgi:hypothetical protein
MKISRSNRNFLVFIITIHMCFFLWQIFHGNYFLKDSQEYLRAAANLRSDFLLYCGDLTKPLNTELFSRRPPIYPLFLAACSLFSSNPVLILIIQNILSVISIYLVRKIILQLGYSTRYDVLFVVLLMFTPSQFIYANLIMSESFLQFLIVLMIWFYAKYLLYGKKLNGFWFNLILSLSVLTKPVFTLLIYLNLIFWIPYGFKKRKLQPVLLCLMPLLFLLAWQYRNYYKTGVFETSSIETRVLMNYNVSMFLAKTENATDAERRIRSIDSISALKVSYKERNTFLNKQAVSEIAKKPFGYAFFHMTGMAGFFLDPGRFDLVSFFNLDNEKSRGLLFRINEDGIRSAIDFILSHSVGLLVALAVIGLINLFKFTCFIFFILRFKGHNLVTGFIIFLIFYVGLLTGPLGASRFMMPLIPAYIGCCVLFLSKRKEMEILVKDNQKTNYN